MWDKIKQSIDRQEDMAKCGLLSILYLGEPLTYRHEAQAESVRLHSDGVLGEHIWTTGTIAKPDHCSIDVQKDTVRIFHQIAVVRRFIKMLGTVRQARETEGSAKRVADAGRRCSVA